jgi:thiazole synthase ThiGH ThiG subunit
MNDSTARERELADPLIVAGRRYGSRLLVGTGKYKDLDETRLAIEASGAEIVTVAIRRTTSGRSPASRSARGCRSIATRSSEHCGC